MLKIIAVSYTNTLPFIYGLKNSGILQKANLELYEPATCAKKILNKEADIGLIPIAALKNIKKYKIITNYCLGAKGAVKTVILLSKKKLNEINDIYLDSHSKTSIGLINILSKFYWKKNFNWFPLDIEKINTYDKYESILAIGDKTFQLKKYYKYCYDLSEEWYKFTSLPFVFACWVSIYNIETNFIQELNSALKLGVKNIKNIVKTTDNKLLNKLELQNYLQKNMSFFLDNKKKEAIKKYFDYLYQL